jgi:cysteine desulfurase
MSGSSPASEMTPAGAERLQLPGRGPGVQGRYAREVLAYLDHAATTPMRPEVVDAMLPWIGERFGNPSGAHRVARAACAAIDESRDVLAGFLGVDPGGIVFTSGGTEAANLAVNGVLAGRPGPVVTSAVEHPAVARSCASSGHEVRVVPVDDRGVVRLDALRAALTPEVALVSVMLVNHEVGARQPLADVVRLARRFAPGALVHTDAVQAAPWMDLADEAAGVDLISISAHKFGGPQGAGALGVRGNPVLVPVVRGGGQERDRRAGTQSVAAIVGMGAAAAATTGGREVEAHRVGALRDRLADGLVSSIGGCRETGDRSVNAPGHGHLCVEGVESEAMILLLDDVGVCASAGAACASGALERSAVLVAMGVDDALAAGRLRLTLGAASGDDEIDLALKVIPDVVAHLRRAR